MDGFEDHLSSMNLTEVTDRLKYEGYDTDGVQEDIPIDSNFDLSQSNIASFVNDQNQSQSLRQYIYLSKCMYSLHFPRRNRFSNIIFVMCSITIFLRYRI